MSLLTKVLRRVHDSAGPGSAQHAKVVMGAIPAIAVSRTGES
ncbi:hypothetical protein ACFQ0O_01740 [Saccharopolyspora spinosporotrichia]